MRAAACCAPSRTVFAVRPMQTSLSSTLARRATHRRRRRSRGLANDWAVTIAIVDDGGHLLWLQRLDGAAPISAQIAPAKARTAALGRRESKVYEEMINQGRMSFLSAPGARRHARRRRADDGRRALRRRGRRQRRQVERRRADRAGRHCRTGVAEASPLRRRPLRPRYNSPVYCLHHRSLAKLRSTVSRSELPVSGVLRSRAGRAHTGDFLAARPASRPARARRRHGLPRALRSAPPATPSAKWCSTPR